MGCCGYIRAILCMVYNVYSSVVFGKNEYKEAFLLLQNDTYNFKHLFIYYKIL